MDLEGMISDASRVYLYNEMVVDNYKKWKLLLSFENGSKDSVKYLISHKSKGFGKILKI